MNYAIIVVDGSSTGFYEADDESPTTDLATAAKYATEAEANHYAEHIFKSWENVDAIVVKIR